MAQLRLMDTPAPCRVLRQCLVELLVACDLLRGNNLDFDRMPVSRQSTMRESMHQEAMEIRRLVLAAQNAIPGVAAFIDPLQEGPPGRWTSALNQTLANLHRLILQGGFRTYLSAPERWNAYVQEIQGCQCYLANADYSAVRQATNPPTPVPDIIDTDPRLWSDPFWNAINRVCIQISDHPENIVDKTPEAPEGLNMLEVNRLAIECGISPRPVIESKIEQEVGRDMRRWVIFHHPSVPLTVEIQEFGRMDIFNEPPSKFTRAIACLRAWRDARKHQLLRVFESDVGDATANLEMTASPSQREIEAKPERLTLEEIGKRCHRSASTVKGWFKGVAPCIPGGGGAESVWDWNRVKPLCEKKLGVKLD